MTERFVADTSLLINFFNGHPAAITCECERRAEGIKSCKHRETIGKPSKTSEVDQLTREYRKH